MPSLAARSQLELPLQEKCSIRPGTFANHVEGTALQPICWLSSGAVPEEEKCQAVSEPGDVITIVKGR